MPLTVRALSSAALLASSLLICVPAQAQNGPPLPRPPVQNIPQNGVDPGPRAGLTDAGGPFQSLDTDEWNLFGAAREVFSEVTSVAGRLFGEEGFGLGPRFNHNSCAGCHAHPTVGGTSPARNPQIAVATLHGARNTVPPFITPNGPVRVARFVRNADGTADGGVHGLFVISGRPDAPGCQIVQPDFAGAIATNNIEFRIPTPVYGLGLVESTPDANLRAAFAANAALKNSLGVTGRFNLSANDGTIMRYGWKSQNKSLHIFSGEAYNVEQGVTNELFPNEREGDPSCQFNAGPEDDFNLTPVANATSFASAHNSDSANFTLFMRLLAPPTPVATPAAARGEQVFNRIGCQSCHVAQQTTGPSKVAALDRVTYRPYSDFALHNMGQRLNDRIRQGDAAGADWRTAPLWGLGQRLFFLHDGRTSNLVTAITTHASQGSEANAVIDQYNLLSPQDTADLLAFLRAL